MGTTVEESDTNILIERILDNEFDAVDLVGRAVRRTQLRRKTYFELSRIEELGVE